MVSKVLIWVPVLPSVAVPDDYLAEGGQSVSWRRYAFDRAHCTFLEPHRSSGATWQALKRMGFWRKIHLHFQVWINECRVCAQFRSTGVMAPMRSMLASIEGLSKIPWADVIIDCQGPFTKSARGNCYTVSYHCTFLGVCKVEPFARLNSWLP